MWCCYEVGSALDMHHQGKKFEMATVLPDGSAVVISDGVTAEDEEQGEELRWKHIGAADAHKAHRERLFPMEIAEKLLSTLLQNGQASVEVTAASQKVFSRTQAAGGSHPNPEQPYRAATGRCATERPLELRRAEHQAAL